MKSIEERVELVADLRWSFDGTGEPFQQVLPYEGGWVERIKVKPQTGYTHDIELVKRVLALCEEFFPVETPPRVYVSNRDAPDGNNGMTVHQYDYYSGAPKDAYGRFNTLPFIFLYGKPIPPHPSVTRYLVAHEYGHVVEKHLTRRLTPDDDVVNFQAAYQKLRGVVPVKNDHYGPGTWHRQIGEIFANDFRIIACGVEEKFWPHEGFKHPYEMLCEPEFNDFWIGVKTYGYAGCDVLEEAEECK